MVVRPDLAVQLAAVGGEAHLLAVPDAEVLLLGLVLPPAVPGQGAHRQQDVGMGVVAVGIMDGHIGAHAVADELALDEPGQQVDPLSLPHLDGQCRHEFPSQAAVPAREIAMLGSSKNTDGNTQTAMSALASRRLLPRCLIRSPPYCYPSS